MGNACPEKIWSPCESEKITNHSDCVLNLNGALEFANSLGMSNREAAPLIDQCAPCMITALGGIDGEMCTARNNLSDYQSTLFRRGGINTCKEMIEIVQK